MIYYSHINEDNRVERKLLQSSACETVVAVCGSGERVLSLMDHAASRNFAVVDVNEKAVFLLQLKLAALQKLGVKEYLGFIGHGTSGAKERMVQYEMIRPLLPERTAAFWDKKKRTIGKGILFAGHFEKFLARVRPSVNFFLGPSFHNIFHLGGNKENFPHKRWALLTRIFSSKIVYRAAGNRDPAFVGRSSDPSIIPSVLDKLIRDKKAGNSFMSHLIFKGNLLQMENQHLPPSLDAGVLNSIRERMLRKELNIQYHVLDLLKFTQSYPHQKEKIFYSVSDILSFQNRNYLENFLRLTPNGSLIMVRSFLKNRLSSNDMSELETYGRVALHDEEEATGMYQVFSIHRN